MYTVTDDQEEKLKQEIIEAKRLIGERLRQSRKGAKKTQDDAADLLDTTQQQISKYENGEDLASSFVIMKLAHFYEVKSDFILGLTNRPIDDYPERIQPGFIEKLERAISEKNMSEMSEIVARLRKEAD